MKTIILVFGLALFLSGPSYPQVKAESIIKASYKPIFTDSGDIKYYNFNSKKNELNLYNLDDSLWKNIRLSLNKNEYFENILLISEETLRPDNQVEIVYTTTRYSTGGIEENPELANRNIKYCLKIINENGENILSVPGSHMLKVAGIDENKKLLIYKNQGKAFSNDNEILVYSLPLK